MPAPPAAATSPPSAAAEERRPGAGPRTEWPAGAIPVSEPDSPSKAPVIGAIVLVLLLVGVGLWLLGRSRGAPVTTVRSIPAPGPSVVRAPAAPPGPPVAAQPAQPAPPARPGMPEDVRRYLNFLQQVEAQRKAYEGQLTNKMLAVVPSLLMPNFDSETVQAPDQQVIGQFKQLAQAYTQATIRFQAVARQVGVPPACRKLHADYSAALSMNPRTIQQAADSISSGNYSGLLSMRSSVGKNIEDYYQAADQDLANICNQYGVQKTFDIGNTGGGQSILLP